MALIGHHLPALLTRMNQWRVSGSLRLRQNGGSVGESCHAALCFGNRQQVDHVESEVDQLSQTCRFGARHRPLEKPTVIGPLKQGLPLPGTAKWITRITVFHNLSCMALEGSPSGDLTPILFPQPSPGIISTVPLEPSARVLRIYPALLDPHAERHTRTYPEVI